MNVCVKGKTVHWYDLQVSTPILSEWQSAKVRQLLNNELLQATILDRVDLEISKWHHSSSFWKTLKWVFLCKIVNTISQFHRIGRLLTYHTWVKNYKIILFILLHFHFHLVKYSKWKLWLRPICINDLPSPWADVIRLPSMNKSMLERYGEGPLFTTTSLRTWTIVEVSSIASFFLKIIHFSLLLQVRHASPEPNTFMITDNTLSGQKGFSDSFIIWWLNYSYKLYIFLLYLCILLINYILNKHCAVYLLH